MKKNKNLFGVLIIIILIFSLFLLLFFRIDSDYLWHIKAGEYMTKNGILRSDVFSWYLQGKYWFSHEWLFDILIYGFSCLFGKIHVLVYAFITIFGLLSVLFLTNKKGFLKNIPFTLLWFLMFFVLIIGYIQARPHMISFILLALSIYFLYDNFRNEDSRKIYCLPLITIVWSNIHGGSSNLPYLFCLIFILGGLKSFSTNKIEGTRLSKKQFLKYLIVMFLCIISVCINVHGVKMLFYPYSNMMDSVMINNISEWRSTSLNDIYHYIYFLCLLFIIFTMLFSKRKIQFIDLLLFMIVTFLGLKSIRFWIYLYIVMSFVIFDYVDDRESETGTLPGILVLMGCLLFIFGLNFKNIRIDNLIYLDKDVITSIKKEAPERLFNMYDYGGELIYNDIEVFIDGRADLYSKYNYKDYLDISLLRGDYVKLIDKYKFDYFLIDKKYPLYTYVKYNNDFSLVYSNSNLIFVKKKNSS